MVEKLTTSGRLSRVETKFAFIETSLGSVFCPLAAAIPANEHVPNFSNRYAVGDMVHITMVPQEGKNGCKWRAVKVRPMAKQAENASGQVTPTDSSKAQRASKTNILTNQVVTVTNVCETLAYGVNDTHGSVFIPGAAFSSQEVTRLNSYLSIGDELLVSMRAQGDVNGCKFIATSATKLKKSCDPQITGSGKIVSLTESCASIWSSVCGEIKCSLLSWVGGDGGKDAEWLTDILNVGDAVLFTAVKRGEDDQWKVVKWTARGFRLGLERVNLADSYTQTAMSTSDITMRYLAPALETMLSDKPTLRSFLTQLSTIVCAVLSTVDPPTIEDDTGSATLSSIPDNVQAEAGDTCLFLFDCTVQPPKCLRVTAIPPDLVPVMKYQLHKFREYQAKTP
ncbi:unnamed protein product [Cylicocyclus nassatus]|uniref:DUF7930 domain-containing protein n=1 Tax=Cylicocyclus nassatus TaxID=53992 RepID=A0AA36H2B2_CYLNA|nr:unnamed protein product [Cylicocyclus nassatus]